MPLLFVFSLTNLDSKLKKSLKNFVETVKATVLAITAWVPPKPWFEHDVWDSTSETALLTTTLLQFEENSGGLTQGKEEVPAQILHVDLQPNEMSGTRYLSAGSAGSPTPLGDPRTPAQEFRSMKETEGRAKGERGEEIKVCWLMS